MGMHDGFLSYRRSNSSIAEGVYNVLSKFTNGGFTKIDIFFDRHDMSRDLFEHTLKENVISSGVLIVIATKDYLTPREGEDWCLFEVYTALANNIPIVPLFIDGSANNAKTHDEIFPLGDYLFSEDEVFHNPLAKKELCRQILRSNGINLEINPNEPIEKAIGKKLNDIMGLVFDTKCLFSKMPLFYKELDQMSNDFSKIMVSGHERTMDFFSKPSFLKMPTKEEMKAKKSKEDCAPIKEDFDSVPYEKDNLIIVGEAGQGKSTALKMLASSMAKKALSSCMSVHLMYPLFFRCQSGVEAIRSSLAAHECLHNQRLVFLDGFDEIASKEQDDLLNLIELFPDNKYIFSSRPGVARIVGGEEMSMFGHPLRQLKMCPLDLLSRDSFVKKRFPDSADLIAKLNQKEEEIDTYKDLTRNPFMLNILISLRGSLPKTKIEAISRYIDAIIGKNENKISSDLMVLITGAMALDIYRNQYSTDEIFINEKKVIKNVLNTYGSPSNVDDVILELKTNNIFNEEGFLHENYAAYFSAVYIFNTLSKHNPEDDESKEYKEFIDIIEHPKFDYYKKVVETLLCYIDYTSETFKPLSSLLDDMQQTPDYDLIFSAAKDFVIYKEEAFSNLFAHMLYRGEQGIKTFNKKTYASDQGANPYEELFYYVVLFFPSDILDHLTSSKEIRGLSKIDDYLISELRYLTRLDLAFDYTGSKTGLDMTIFKMASSDKRGEKGRHAKIKGHVNYTEEPLPINLEKMTSFSFVNFSGEINTLFLFSCGNGHLRRIAIYGENEKYSSIGECLIDKEQKALIRGCDNSKIQASIGLVAINDYAFSSCVSLKEVIVPKGITSIGKGAFIDCSSLALVKMPITLKEIGENAFANCLSLPLIKIPCSVASIGEGAFEGCSSLSSLSVDKNNQLYFSIGNCIINRKDKKIIIGCGKSMIPDDDNVTSIDASAFNGCPSLKEIKIPSTITSIEAGAFAFSSSIDSIEVEAKNKVYSSADNCLLSKDGSKLYLGCHNSIIPDSVRSIEPFAFSGVSRLEQISIPDSVRYIRLSAFQNAPSLREVTLGHHLLFIDQFAFAGCQNLEDISIPPSTLLIGTAAFANCPKLKKVTISSKAKIEKNSFDPMTKVVRKAYDPISMLFDDSCLDPIIVYDDKDNPIYLDQVAMIPLNGAIYAILKPAEKMEGIAPDEAIVFEVLKKEKELHLVEDEFLINLVMRTYFDCLPSN